MNMHKEAECSVSTTPERAERELRMEQLMKREQELLATVSFTPDQEGS